MDCGAHLAGHGRNAFAEVRRPRPAAGLVGCQARAPKRYRPKMMSGDPQSRRCMLSIGSRLWRSLRRKNAAGGQVVTAPTNVAPPGSCLLCCITTALRAGLMMAGCALFYSPRRSAAVQAECIHFRGRDGSRAKLASCSWRAAGLVSALHGSNEQIENSARNRMEPICV